MGQVSLRQWEHRLRDMLEIGGLWTKDVTAPSYEELRPYGHRETAGFPVYKDLEERLLRMDEHPDPVIAHVMATCAGYAYSDSETLSMIMARLGLPDNQCRVISAKVDAMFIHSTAYVIQSRSGRVAIVCYRGADPRMSAEWLCATDVEPERIPYQFGDPCATVHTGFYRNVRATRHEVMGALERAGRRLSVRAPLLNGAANSGPMLDNGLEALYITGHGHGGAMAAMMGVMLRHERKYRDEYAHRLRAVYTFGQPMIGDRGFARACEQDDFLREQVVRYVYDRDPVPSLPSTMAGPYCHFGQEYHYRVPRMWAAIQGMLGYAGCTVSPPKGELHYRIWPSRQMPGAMAMALGGLDMIGRTFGIARMMPMMYSLEDHHPHHYIAAAMPYGVQNEFGD